MTDREIRIKCLEMALQRCISTTKGDIFALDIDIKNIALSYYELVTGETTW